MIPTELHMLRNNIPGSISQYTSSISPDQEVEYDDAQHKYYINDKGKLINYISATTIVSRFYEKFDTESQIIRMANKYGETPDYWRTKWHEDNQKSIVRGQSIHSYEERFLYNRGYSCINGSTHIVYPYKSRINSIGELPDGVYPELKMWNHIWRIAGRADKPTFETINGIRFAHVEDYKTNKIIRKEGYSDSKIPERMMLYPLEHLPDCEYTHYTLQLSIYQFMLEYFGYTPGLRRLIHFPHPIEDLGVPDPVIYELPYLKDEVLAMLIVLNEIPL